MPSVRRFTLIELLVVVSIIAVLASLLLPALAAARAKAKDGTCISFMRQNGMACQMYADDNEDRPPLYMSGTSPWHIHLRDLGYLPNDYRQTSITLAVTGATEQSAANGMINGSWAKRAPNFRSSAVCPMTKVKPVFQVDDANRPYYYDLYLNRHLMTTSYSMNECTARPNSWGQSGVPNGFYRFGEMADEADMVALMYDAVATIGWASINVGIKSILPLRHLDHYNVILYDLHVGAHREGPNNAYDYYPFWPRRSPVTAGNQSHPYNKAKFHYRLN